ncbi:MAG: YcjF family protein [Microcoleaceae cyanobacterium]
MVENFHRSSDESQSSELDEVIKSFANEAASNLQNLIEAGTEVTTQLTEDVSVQVQQLLENALKETGNNLTSIAENPVVRSLTNFFGTGWLRTILGEVDTEALQKRVTELQQKYPSESSDQIAHRVILGKAIQAGGVGIVTNAIPPLAAALFAVDLATTTRLQTEMVYQIAGAYGLDLDDPIRRGEVLAIFGLSLGGSSALKVGLGLVEIIPGVGIIVGASSNAVLLYVLGYAARRFYEAKLHPEQPVLTPQEFSEENEAYLQSALEQEKVMDQILMHLVLARYPDKDWSDIIPELQKENLSPRSIHAISNHIQDHQPLDQLLERLDSDFAPPLFAQCRRIVQNGDAEVSPKEQEILDKIANQFQLESDKGSQSRDNSPASQTL